MNGLEVAVAIVERKGCGRRKDSGKEEGKEERKEEGRRGGTDTVP